MDDNDAEKLVIDELKKNGLTDFEIIINTWVVGSNVRTIVTKKDNLTITFTIDNDVGVIINKQQSKHYERNIVESPIVVTDHVETTATLYFELYNKYYVGGRQIDSPPIKIISDPTDAKSIIAFQISVSDTEEETIKEANEKATRFVNFLGLMQNQPVKHKRPRIKKSVTGKTTQTVTYTVDAVLVQVFDLDLTETIALLDKDSMLNQKLAHTQEGIRALADNDYAKAISEFWIVIENENLGMAKQYDNLRHAVNHNKINSPKTIEDLKNNFGINMKVGEYLNINDPFIQNILEKSAYEMNKHVVSYLNNELSSNSYV